jgi:hypothetical protein
MRDPLPPSHLLRCVSLALRRASHLIPFVLALTVAGQPLGELVCGVACEGRQVASQPAAPSHTHPCHEAGSTATPHAMVAYGSDTQASLGRPCRQTVAAIGEDSCVWAWGSCSTLVPQKTASALPAVAAASVRLNPPPEISLTHHRPPTLRDVALRLSTTLRI